MFFLGCEARVFVRRVFCWPKIRHGTVDGCLGHIEGPS